MKMLGIELTTQTEPDKIQNIKEDEDEKEIHSKFRKLFETNHTIKNMEIDTKLKPGANRYLPNTSLPIDERGIFHALGLRHSISVNFRSRFSRVLSSFPPPHLTLTSQFS